MKSKLTIFTLSLLFNISFGQSNKYFMNKLGNIIDQEKI